MAGSVLDLTDEQFDDVCLKSDVPVLVDFWAPWCGPCKAMAPTIEKLADELGDKAKICKHNIDDHPTAPMNHSVTAIPTLLFFKGGEEVHREVGATKSGSDLKKILQDRCGLEL